MFAPDSTKSFDPVVLERKIFPKLTFPAGVMSIVSLHDMIITPSLKFNVALKTTGIIESRYSVMLTPRISLKLFVPISCKAPVSKSITAAPASPPGVADIAMPWTRCNSVSTIVITLSCPVKGEDPNNEISLWDDASDRKSFEMLTNDEGFASRVSLARIFNSPVL